MDGTLTPLIKVWPVVQAVTLAFGIDHLPSCMSIEMTFEQNFNLNLNLNNKSAEPPKPGLQSRIDYGTLCLIIVNNAYTNCSIVSLLIL